MNILGLHGYTGSGKDTIAEMLVKRGWKRVAFADPVREMLYALNPRIHTDGDDYAPLQFLVDSLGWDTVKRSYPEVREWLQNLATVIRKTLGDTCFVDLAERKIKDIFYSKSASGVVVTDVRHDIEVSMLQNLVEEIMDASMSDEQVKCFIAEVVRPSCGPINSHSSEQKLIDRYPLFHILNNGSIEDLQYNLMNSVLPGLFNAAA